MNKLFKRTTAFVLMVCLLCALAVPAIAAEPAATPVVYDFELDTTDYKWSNYSFAGSGFPHTNSAWQSVMDELYANGDLNWNYPHAVDEERYQRDPETGDILYGTEDEDGDGELDPLLNSEYGKVISYLTAKSHASNSNLFGSFKYNATETTYDWTGLRIGAASLGATGLSTGWNAITLKAPAAGNYAVTLEYTKYATSSSNTGVYMIPYTDAMKAQVVADPEGFNAYLTTVATGTADKLGSFGSWIASGETPVPEQIADLGEITISAAYDEYLLVLSAPAGKYAYIQNLTLTPAAEQVSLQGAQEAVDKTYAFQASGTVDMSTETGLTTANALSADWDYLGHTKASRQNLTKNATELYGASTDWSVAFKIASPGAGTFDMKMTFKDGSAAKTQVWTSMYIAEYTANMDVTDIANMTKVGEHHPLVKDINTSKHESEVIGQFTFEADKDYVLVLATDQDTYKNGKEYDTDEDGVTDIYMTNNLYLYNIIAHKDATEGTPVPKAYIGETPYGTMAAALAAAQSGDVIKLAADFIGTVDLPAGVSIDLNGYTLDTDEIVTTTASEAIIDSKGTGKLITKSTDLFGNNANTLPLATGNNTYALAQYELTVDAQTETSPANAAATRFWFKLDMADADLDLIAAGNTGLTIGVELDWGAAEGLAVTFDQGEGAEAFAAAWAAAYKAGNNVWLYVDIVGVDTLDSNLTVKPVLKSADSTLWNGTITYTVG